MKGHSFPIPLEYVDVVRRTNTTFEVFLESLANWNVDGGPELSKPWTAFTKLKDIDKKNLQMDSRGPGAADKNQGTSRPDSLWPEIWSSMSYAAQHKEKQRWAFEKPKLDNAGILRSIYFIDPDDMEFKDTMENARKKLDALQGSKHWQRENLWRTNFHCSQIKMRVHRGGRRIHEKAHWTDSTTRSWEGIFSLSHCDLVHKFILMFHAMKIPDAKAV